MNQYVFIGKGMVTAASSESEKKEMYIKTSF
jgi:hypothetical protein